MQNPIATFFFNVRLFFIERLSRFRKWVIGPHVDALLVNSKNGLLLVNAQDYSPIGRQLVNQGHYEPKNLQLLLTKINNESQILVVGSHIGALLIPLAKKAKYACGVEANPETFQFTALNQKLNELKNMELHNCAAGDKNGTTLFYASKTNSGGSKIKPQNDYYEFTFDKPDVIEVPMHRLDDLLKENNKFDLIVMDIEGAEYIALQGMPEILSHCNCMQVEYIPNHLKKVSGATPEQFLSVFSDQFDTAQVVGTDKRFEQSDFVEMLEWIAQNSTVFGGYDIIFEKK